MISWLNETHTCDIFAVYARRIDEIVGTGYAAKVMLHFMENRSTGKTFTQIPNILHGDTLTKKKIQKWSPKDVWVKESDRTLAKRCKNSVNWYLLTSRKIKKPGKKYYQ